MDSHIVREIFSGEDTDYVKDNIIREIVKEFEFKVKEKSALDNNEFYQDSIISVSLPNSTEDLEDDYFIREVRKRMEEKPETMDTQKYQVRHEGAFPNTIMIHVHNYGYSVYLIKE